MSHQDAARNLLSLAQRPRIAEFNRIAVPMFTLPGGVHGAANGSTLHGLFYGKGATHQGVFTNSFLLTRAPTYRFTLVHDPVVFAAKREASRLQHREAFRERYAERGARVRALQQAWVLNVDPRTGCPTKTSE